MLKPLTKPYALRIGARKVLIGVDSFADACRTFLRLQRRAMDRGGVLRYGTVYDANGTREVARVSQNGKVWPPESWHVAQEPLYVPTDADYGYAPEADVV